MGIFGAPGGNVYYDPNNEFARNYVASPSKGFFGNAILDGNNDELKMKFGLSRDPNVLKSSSSGNKVSTPSVSKGIPTQQEATALDAFKIKDKEDTNISSKKISNQKGNKSLTIPVGNSGGVSMIGKV